MARSKEKPALVPKERVVFSNTLEATEGRKCPRCGTINTFIAIKCATCSWGMSKRYQ